MKLVHVVSVVGALCAVFSSGLANAEEPSPVQPAEAEGGHASGFMVQGRLQAQGGLLSLGGGPGFLLGYQGQSFALGLGLGLTRLGVSGDDGDLDASVTLLQVMPTAMLDVWRSRDGRAKANLVGGLGFGRASVSGTGTTESCVTDPIAGETCTTERTETSVGATLIPFLIGFGGDYFLSRNFALGAEAGLQGAFVTGLSSESDGTSQDIDAAGNMQFTYGLLRATLVLGD